MMPRLQYTLPAVFEARFVFDHVFNVLVSSRAALLDEINQFKIQKRVIRIKLSDV